MEFGSPLSVTVDMIPPIKEPNLEDLQRMNIFSCPRCLIDLGNFVIFVTIFSGFIALPIIDIVIGSVYQNECSMNHYIPIYLIVAGLITLINSIFAFLGWFFIWPLINNFKLKTIKSVLFDAGIFCQFMLIIGIIFLLFDLAWFIAGNIWVFTSRPTVQYTNPIEFPNTYCNRIVYLSGFWSIIVKYIFVWIIICRLNCYLCFDIQQLLVDPNPV